MADFIVKLDGIKLDTKATEEVNRALQATALRELARLDLAPTYSVRVPRPKEWLGIWIRNRFFNDEELKQKFLVK